MKGLRKLFSILLCGMMLASVPAWNTLAEESDTLDDEYLLEQYIQQQFDAQLPGASALHQNARPESLDMSSSTGKLYQYLVPKIQAIAAGELTSAEFTFDPEAELGIDTHYSAPTEDEAFAGAEEKLQFDNDELLQALLGTLPYDLYWFDKTKGFTYTSKTRCVIYSDHAEAYIAEVTFQMHVSQEYKGTGEFGVNTPGATINQAVANAVSIVDTYRGYANYDKLVAYKESICDLASYNHAAAEDDTTPYGNPWQLIYVFDGDPDTNIVCEGYAKAFKYLCDLTDFKNIKALTVSGLMGGGTGAGRHMWNIVMMDNGKNYLVDVTNCDEGTVGAPDQLFMVGTSDHPSSDTYVFHPNSTQIDYVYDSKIIDYYTDGELVLSDANYITADPSEIFTAHSLTLAGDIGVNFYLDLAGKNASDCTINFTWDKGDVTVEGRDFVKVDTGDPADNIYKVACNVAAKEMTDEITATLTSNGSTIASETYSVLDYATTILEHGTDAVYTKKLKALVENMLAYGAKAQLYFDYKTDNPADKNLSGHTVEEIPDDVLSTLVPTYTADDFDEFGIHYYACNLALNTKTTYRLHFDVIDQAKLDAATIKIDGKTVNYTTSGNRVLISMEDIAAKDILTDHTLTIGSKSYTINAGHYLPKALAKEKESLTALVNALYWYNQASVDYFN